MKVFISWSGERSRALALALRDWIPVVIQSVQPWMSQQDISAGQRWGQEIAKNLDDSNFGIICLTPENKNSRWLLFESGALAKHLEDSRVVPLVFDMKMSDLEPPLSQFQALRADEGGIKQLLESINETNLPSLSATLLDQAFNGQWSILQKKLAQISPVAPVVSPSRSTEEILEELVMTVRGMDIALNEVDHKILFSGFLRETREPSKEPDPEILKALREDLITQMEKLTPQQRAVLLCRFGLDGQGQHTYVQTAQKLGIKPDEVRALEVSAMRAMRNPAEKSKIKRSRKI